MPGVYLSEKQIDITPKIQKNTPAVIPPPPAPPPEPAPESGWSGWGGELTSLPYTYLATITLD